MKRIKIVKIILGVNQENERIDLNKENKYINFVNGIV